MPASGSLQGYNHREDGCSGSVLGSPEAGTSVQPYCNAVASVWETGVLGVVFHVAARRGQSDDLDVCSRAAQISG